MAHIDTGDRALQEGVNDVRDDHSETAWVLITYAPQRDNPSGNRLKVQGSGTDYDDLRDSFDEGKAQFALYRHRVKEIWRYVFISWCGEGVQGMQRGRFGDHAVDMERWIAPFHLQVNARNEDDLDLDKIILPRLYKALGADYDAGGLEQSTQREGSYNASSYNQKADMTKIQQESAAFWSSDSSKASVQGSGYQKDTSFQATAGAGAKRSAFEDMAKPTAAPEIQRTGRVFQPPKAAPAPAPVKATPAPRPYQQAKTAPTTQPRAAAPPPAAAAAPPPQPPKPAYQPEPAYEEPAYEEPAYEEPAYEEPAYEEPAYEEPAYEEPAYEEPAYEEPAPAYEEPAYEEPQQTYEEGGYGDQGYAEQEAYDGYGEQESYAQYRQVTALYDYTGEGEGDLSFYAGDVINVIDDTDPSGWYRGELNGYEGLFPANFVQ